MKKFEQNKETARKSRKAYKTPALTVYGTINQITESTANGKFADGGTGKQSMTS